MGPAGSDASHELLEQARAARARDPGLFGSLDTHTIQQLHQSLGRLRVQMVSNSV